MTEIQGKSILVRVSARFELARVRVIGSRLYSYFEKSFHLQNAIGNTRTEGNLCAIIMNS